MAPWTYVYGFSYAVLAYVHMRNTIWLGMAGEKGQKKGIQPLKIPKKVLYFR
jgi:hypothetical protein